MRAKDKRREMRVSGLAVVFKPFALFWQFVHRPTRFRAEWPPVVLTARD